MKKFELLPINGRKSFYNKAIVVEENGVSELFSYDTLVAQYSHHTNEMRVFGTYSNTTTIHINAFLSLNGFDICTKKELIKIYNLARLLKN